MRQLCAFVYTILIDKVQRRAELVWLAAAIGGAKEVPSIEKELAAFEERLRSAPVRERLKTREQIIYDALFPFDS